MARPPILLWFRRDLRLADHPALAAACATGQPIIPVFIHDEVVDGLGAAPKWRLGLGVGRFAETLEEIGTRLILRRGRALDVLEALIAETGATGVFWSRAYDPASKARDIPVKAALKKAGRAAESHPGHLLHEPWRVETQTGGFYRVYSPFWRAVKDRDVGGALSAPTALPTPRTWPESEALESWDMGGAMRRGAGIVGGHVAVGEAAAADRLQTFIGEGIAGYRANRDNPGITGTSRLSENLTYGEISPRQCWQAGWRALQDGAAGAETFLKELVWREFAYHLIHHTPHIVEENWRREWDGFPWTADEDSPEILAWKQGRTGYAFVDAAMRELYVTGYMHNRARMIVASFLTKHLMTHWKVGQRWFEDCLTDWDPASNAMGWQWTAGSGPDAAPYFRVFNPETQLAKFDPEGRYPARWIAEGQTDPPETALSFFDAIPESWSLGPDDGLPSPIIGLAEGRARALHAYENRGF